MKKFLALLLSCIFLLSLTTAAFAEPETTLLEVRDAELNVETNTIAVRRAEGACYELVDAEGAVLVSADEEYVAMSPEGAFFTVDRAAEGILPCRGLISGQGEPVIPVQYHDVEVISERWQSGIMLTSADPEDWDYCFFLDEGDEYYKVDYTDFYFDGELVGSLDRGACASVLRAYGAYLCTYGEAGDYHFFNSSLEPSPYDCAGSDEFDWIFAGGKQVYYHQGSGQIAFDPECTLDPDELQSPYLYRDGALYDLKGQRIARFPRAYDEVGSFVDGYAVVERRGYYGLVTLEGEELIPPEYDELGSFEARPLRFGYISAVRDGMLGFLDAQGQVSCDFSFPETAVTNYATFAELETEEGIGVISAAAGELPMRFAWVSFPDAEGCLAFVGCLADGRSGVVDIEGDTLVPFSSEYLSLQVSLDGSVALVEMDNCYLIYRF